MAIFLAGAGVFLWRAWPRDGKAFRFIPERITRPYGMAPAAFEGFLRACNNAHVQPRRIGQTIGDHPLSMGYHLRDGWVKWRGQSIEYTAAVDLDASDLNRAQLNGFLEVLAAQGFAAFYREKGKWRGNEHIHAIYAPLRMKPQLRGQVRQWLEERSRNHRRKYRWQTRWQQRWKA